MNGAAPPGRSVLFPGRARGAILGAMDLGKYRDLLPLGQGGMGTVFRARSPEGGDVAIKMLTRLDASARERFDRERRLLASFTEAEGFVPLVDAGDSSAGPYLVMPLVPGGTLRSRLARGALGATATLELGKALAAALGKAHERGVVHRDLKPENILFAADGRPLVADLGLAKHFDREALGASRSVSLSRDGMLRGTAGYMAPEQLQDAKRVGPAADVFGLGAILYECLSGRPAFAGDSVLDVVALACQGRFEPLATVAPEVPRWLAAVVERALASSPGERHEDALALGRALARGPTRPAWPLAGATLALVLILAAPGAWWLAHDPAPKPSRPAPPPASRDVDELMRRVRDALARNDCGAAIEDATRAIALDPRRVDAFVNRCAARMRLKDHDGALADANRAVELAPSESKFWANRGGILEERGEHERAIEDLTKAIDLSPDNPFHWTERAKARLAKGDPRGAYDDLTRALELEPGLSRAWQGRAETRGAMRDFDGALADANRAVELDPGDAMALATRALARQIKGDNAGAIEDATRSIELDPGDSRPWRVRGAARAETGDRAGAAADLRRFLELAPDDPLAPTAREWLAGRDADGSADDLARSAERRRVEGDLDGSIADSTRAIALEPRRARLWISRSFARVGKGDVEGALADAEHAIELDPRDATAWAARSIVRVKKSDLDGALADASHAIEVDPGSAAAWANRSEVRLGKKDHAGAIEDATRALELNPKDALCWAIRGDARAALGDVPGATSDYRRFLELSPDDELAPRVRAWLEKKGR